MSDPTEKSKSDAKSLFGGSLQGTVYVTDEPAAVAKKFRASVTDSGTDVRRAPAPAFLGL